MGPPGRLGAAPGGSDEPTKLNKKDNGEKKKGARAGKAGQAAVPDGDGEDVFLDAIIAHNGELTVGQLRDEMLGKELAQNKPVPQGNLQAFFEQVKLLCTVYDPVAGRYRVNYVIVAELLVGASIILGILTFLVVEWRRRRRPSNI